MNKNSAFSYDEDMDLPESSKEETKSQEEVSIAEKSEPTLSLPDNLDQLKRRRASSLSKESTEKKPSIWSLKSKIGGLWGKNKLWWFSLKGNNFISSIGPVTIIIALLWLTPAIAWIYGYNNNLFSKIKELPLLRANLVVAQENLDIAEKAYSYLKKLSVDPRELTVKEDILSKYLITENAKLAFQQVNILNQIVKESGVYVASYKKQASPPEFTKAAPASNGLTLESLEPKISNDSKYISYWVEVHGTEDQIIHFLERVEKTPMLFIDSPSFSRSEGPGNKIKLSTQIKWYYLLTTSKNGNTR